MKKCYYLYEMNENQTANVKTVLEVLSDECRGDVRSALAKLALDYTMTWVYKAPKTGELFPSTKKSIGDELDDVYQIKGRHYDIKHIAESDDGAVFVEMVESYPDPKTNQVYRTPLVLVLEMRDGKIKTGRHYCDPNLSYLNLTEEQVEKVFK